MDLKNIEEIQTSVNMFSMNSKELLQSITNEFFLNKTERILYFSLSGSAMDNCKNLFGEETVFFDLAFLKSPLAPFLDILKFIKPSVSDLKDHVYKMHEGIFTALIEEGKIVERNEPIVIEEIDFEKIRIRDTIVHLIEKRHCKNVVVLNCQLISDDALSILKKLPSKDLQGKFIFCFDNMDVDNYSPSVKNFVNSIVGSSCYYSINTFESIVEDREYHLPDDDNSFETMIERLRSMRIFMDFSQAYRLVKKIDSRNLLEEYDFNQKRSLNFEMGLASHYAGDSDFATFCFSNVAETRSEDMLECYANYMLASLANIKNMTTTALNYINKALVCAKKFSDEPIYALLMMLEYIITERSTSGFSTQKYFNAISLLEKVGYINNKVYASLIIPYGVIFDTELRSQMRVQIQKSMDESLKNGNKFELSTACHWMGIIMTHEGRKNNALEWYQKGLQLRREIGDISSITKITNGIAFENLVDTQYKVSYDLINDCVHNLMDSRDYPEIVITLFNFTRACFYSKNMDLAYNIIQCIFNLLNIFDISDLSGNSFIPEYNDVLVYIALIDFYRGEYNRSKMNLYNVSNNGKRLDPIENFLRQFLLASIELQENNIEFAIKNFNECVEGFISKKFNQDHIVVFMCYEFALMLRKYRQFEESDRIFVLGNEIAQEKGLLYYTQGKKNFTLSNYEASTIKFDPLKIDLSMLEEKAEKEKLVNQLHRRLRDSKFLNKLVTTHVQNSNDLGFMQTAVQAIFDYTMADAVFMAEKTADDGWVVHVSSIRDQVGEPTKSMWEAMCNERYTVHVDVMEDGRNVVCINLSKFEFVGGLIIYLQHNMQLSVEERAILNVAASNVQAQLIMIKQNEYLSKISATDQLSKLNNRRALMDHLGVQSEMIRRYDKKRSVHMKETICFMDLDNFKYYNDTFGHEAGDLLISCFAKLLKRIYRKVDFVARFGGDEFVVMLPNTDCLEAKRAAERLSEGLEKAQYFLPELCELLGKNARIPVDKYLNFSMGICSNDELEDVSDLETIMNRADKALYYSKQHNKGSVTIWEEVPQLKEESAAK